MSTFAATAKSLQSCLTLCDPIASSPSGSTLPGILQARTLVINLYKSKVGTLWWLVEAGGWGN